VNQKVIKFIKKYPLLYQLAKFSYQLFLLFQSHRFFINSLLFDPAIIKGKWYTAIKKTQLDVSKPLFSDRQNEIKEFFKVNCFYLTKYYLKYGFPQTSKFKEHYLQPFYGNTEPGKLKKAYDNVSFEYSLRLMLAYERYSMITDFLDFIIEDSAKRLSELKILDYGCGVSDIGLLFCSFGAEVTICDLDNKKLDFTIWRFKKRGGNPEIIRIADTEIYPELPESKFDLIIATELFEHVRDPLKLLKNFTKSLKSGGYLLDSMGGDFKRGDRPEHLKEAFEIGQSRKYIAFYSRHYIHLFPEKERRYLFKKR
jgi:SAM-dependent methyltransferase